MGDKTTIKVVDISGERQFSLDAMAFGLGLDVLVIGTAADCQIKIENPKVSAHHGCFFKQDNMWAYQDMDSEAGSSVQGEMIRTTWLSNGMQLVLDSKRFSDSTIIEIIVNSAGANQIVPREIHVRSGAVSAYGYSSNAGAYGRANSGNGFRGGLNSVYGNGGGTGVYGGFRRPGSASGLSIFGLIAGILWAILGIIQIIFYFWGFGDRVKAITEVGEYAIFQWVILIAVAVYIAGMITLSVGLFSYNKKTMKYGSIILATGYTTNSTVTILFIFIVAGQYISFLLKDYKIDLALITNILISASFIIQAINFCKNCKSRKIYNLFFVPYIFSGIGFLCLAATINTNEVNNINTLQSSSSSSSSNIWMLFPILASIIMSGIYLHVDENPQKAAKYALRRRNYGYGAMQGQNGLQNYMGPQNYGNQQGYGPQSYNGQQGQGYNGNNNYGSRGW